MQERTEIVTAMLRIAHQIAKSNEFARDATIYADMARDLADHDAAFALRSMVVARKAEVVRLRRLMSRLAETLARMPIEAE